MTITTRILADKEKSCGISFMVGWQSESHPSTGGNASNTILFHAL